MQIHRQSSPREDIKTCWNTDEEMTVNSTVKENDALRTLYPKAHGSLPILLHRQGNWAVILSLKAVKHIYKVLPSNANYRVTGFNKRL